MRTRLKLDEAKSHTIKKIEYVTEYVKEWLRVAVNNKNDIDKINFIDCMCNAGEYQGGQLGTPVEVFKLFLLNAHRFSQLHFNLFFNDYDRERVLHLKELIIKNELPSNLNVYYSNLDVNEFLEKISVGNKQNKDNFGYAFTILFADPYKLGLLEIKERKYQFPG